MRRFLLLAPLFFLSNALTPTFGYYYPVPAGTYQNTCMRCGMWGRQLTCYCNNRRGVPVHTALFITDHCQPVVNNNGILQCTHGYGYLPAGNYQKTCGDCVMRGRQLSCYCNNVAGQAIPTSTHVPHHCTYVQNLNGQLACTKYRHSRPYGLFNVSAGPIWNNGDAQQKCPPVCANYHGQWTGQWHTVEPAANSVCECRA